MASSSWQGKSKGRPWGYRFFVAVLKTGGVRPAYFLLYFVALYYLLFSWQSTKHTVAYFNKRLRHSLFRSIVNTYQNYILLGQALIDKVVIMSGIPNKFSFNFDGVEHLHEIVAQKKGGLLLSAHIGNWDIAGHMLPQINTAINIVVFDGEDKGIKEYMASVTGKSPVNFIVIQNDMSHIFKISAALANNELVCMHADRFVEGNKTVTVNFLGAEAKFPAGPFMLASRFKVPVSFVFAIKEGTFHYHFFATEIKDYSLMDKNAAPQQMLQDFVLYMENKVKTYPKQWYNYYNFWQ